jgi:hypothetical protein
MVVATTVAGQRITTAFLAGTALVLAGVYVGAPMPTSTKQEELWKAATTLARYSTGAREAPVASTRLPGASRRR